jgi:hypothetical protein
MFHRNPLPVTRLAFDFLTLAGKGAKRNSLTSKLVRDGVCWGCASGIHSPALVFDSPAFMA